METKAEYHTLDKWAAWDEYEKIYDAKEALEQSKIEDFKIIQLRRFSVGKDDRGNEIEYIEQPEGFWLCTWNEMTFPDQYIQKNFKKQLAAIAIGG
jgi:hypothetical protein